MSIRESAADLGGALIVEQYPNSVTTRPDVWSPIGDSLVAMKRLKAAWDPKDILSPGRFAGDL